MGSTRLRLPRNLFMIVALGSVCVFSTGCFAPVAEEPPAPQGLDDGSAIRPADDVREDEGNFDVVEEPVENPLRDDEPVVDAPPQARADLNDDGTFDEEDQQAFRDQFGSTADDDDFDPAADFDGDGEITLIDFQMFLEFASDNNERE